MACWGWRASPSQSWRAYSAASSAEQPSDGSSWSQETAIVRHPDYFAKLQYADNVYCASSYADSAFDHWGSYMHLGSVPPAKHRHFREMCKTLNMSVPGELMQTKNYKLTTRFSPWVYPKMAHLDKPGGALSDEDRDKLLREAKRCRYEGPVECPPA